MRLLPPLPIMATNWVVPTAADLRKVLANPVVDKLNQAGEEGSAPRAAAILALVVKRFRGVIKNNSRNQISATAGSIPDECELHVLALTARILINSIPTASSTLGVTDDFLAALCTPAEDWLKSVRDGYRVTVPTDPESELAGPDFGGTTYVDMTTDAAPQPIPPDAVIDGGNP